MLTIVILILLALGALAHCIYISQRNHRIAKTWHCKPPHNISTGPLGIQAFRCLARSSKNGHLSASIHSLHQTHGPTFTTTLLGNDPVFTIDPENIKHVLATHFEDFGLGIRNPQFYPLIGDGIFSLDGEGWAHSRTLLKPQFTRSQVSDLHCLDRHVQRFLSALPKDTSPFDIQELFVRLGLDSSTDFLFGESVNSLVSGEEKVNDRLPYSKAEFREAFEYTQQMLVRRVQAQKFYWLVTSRKFRDACAVVQGFIDYYVDKAVTMQKAQNGAISSPSMRYIFLEALAAQTSDRRALRDQLLHIMLAGRDTTSSLLSTMVFFLARDPQMWCKLREEVVCEFGTAQGQGKEITFESMKELPYLKCVINEGAPVFYPLHFHAKDRPEPLMVSVYHPALRLIPPVPLNGRVAVKDTLLPRGGGSDGLAPIFVRKGRSIRYSCFALHRRPDIWGPDADEFCPERWESVKSRGWEFLPFNGGPRICLGQQKALTEASYIMIKLLQSFDGIEDANHCRDGDFVPREAPSLVWTYRDGVYIRLRSSG